MATSEFGKAFAAARKAGGRQFEFKGKKYTTKTAEDESKAAKEKSDAKQRERSDMMKALTKAEKEAPAGTSNLAREKIAESKRKVTRDYETAGNDMSATGATVRSMDTDMMRTASRTAAKEAGQRRKASAEDAAKAKDKATYKKGGFVPFAAAAKKPGVKKPGITKPGVKKPAVKKPMPSFMMKRGSKK